MQGKLQLGGMRMMFGTWMRRVAFGVASLKKTLDAKGRWCTGGKKAKQQLTWAFL